MSVEDIYYILFVLYSRALSELLLLSYVSEEELDKLALVQDDVVLHVFMRCWHRYQTLYLPLPRLGVA